jgi:hypothetical protein
VVAQTPLALDISSRDKRKFVQNVVKSIEKQTRKKRAAVELPLQDRTAEHLNRDIRSESRLGSSGGGSGAREDGGED